MSEKLSLRSALDLALHLDRPLRLVWQSAPRWTAVQLALVLVQGLLPLAGLYLTKGIVDAVSAGLGHANASSAFPRVLTWILLAAGVAVLAAACRSLSEMAAEAQSLQVTDAVSDQIHAQSIALDLAYYEDPTYYDTLHRAQQEALYRPSRILHGLVGVAQGGISLLGIAGLLVSLHWLLGLAVLFAALPAGLIRVYYARKLFAFQEQQTQTERQAWYYHWLIVDSSFAKELRLFHLGPLFQDRFRRLRLKLRQGRLSLAGARLRADFLVQVLAAAAIYGTFGLAAHQALQGSLSLGSLVVIYMGFQNGLGFAQSVLTGLAGLYEDNLFLTHFYQFLQAKPALLPPAHPAPVPHPWRAGLSVRGVSFTYPGSDRPALSGVSLDLAPGEVIALVGENGSGKTTLVKLLCGLYRPTQGQIALDGTDLSRFDPEQWRKEFSVIFQDYAHYYLAAWENIWLGSVERPPDREHIIASARLAGADPALRRLPQGYDTPLGSWFAQGHELSTGEWQKVALARAFWRQASLVVLDEPTASLDPLAEAELFRNFRRLIDGRSAILISHRFSTVQMADCIYVLEAGRVVERGSHASLLRLDGRYARLYHAQASSYQPVPY